MSNDADDPFDWDKDIEIDHSKFASDPKFLILMGQGDDSSAGQAHALCSVCKEPLEPVHSQNTLQMGVKCGCDDPPAEYRIPPRDSD